MANGKRPPPPNSPGARRKRPPTVIDLEASEVAPEPAAAPESAAPSSVQPESPEPQADPAPPPEPFIPPAPAKPADEQQTAFERASFEQPPPPPREPPRADPEPPKTEPRKSDAPGWLPGGVPWPHAIAGASGGLLVALLLWLFGAFSGGPVASTDLSPRLASIEKQLKDIAARPAPAAVNPKTLDEIAGRLARLESAQSAPRAPVTDPVVLGRLGSTENAMKSLADNVAAMSRRVDGADAALREANGKIEKLSAALTELQTASREAAAGSDRASRLAIAAQALRTAVERGEPFVAELAVIKPLAAGSALVAALEPFAATGVPGHAALGQELTTLIRPMQRAAGEPPRDGNFLDRLQANAEKLVRIRPVDETRGDDRGAILARIGQRAARADIPGAVSEIARLPADARAPLQGWVVRAEARNKAVDASRRLAADAVAALKATP